MKKLLFLSGLVIGALLPTAGVYLFFAGGYAPVATSASPLPFEQMLAKKALHARYVKEMPPLAPIEATETNLLAGAAVYQQHCAVCHGLPGESKGVIAQGMFPPPPQLFQGKGVTDDPPEESYWKTANGIRLTGMPGFRNAVPDMQLWQVSLLLAKAHELPESVKSALAAKPASSL